MTRAKRTEQLGIPMLRIAFAHISLMVRFMQSCTSYHARYHHLLRYSFRAGAFGGGEGWSSPIRTRAGRRFMSRITDLCCLQPLLGQKHVDENPSQYKQMNKTSVWPLAEVASEITWSFFWAPPSKFRGLLPGSSIKLPSVQNSGIYAKGM